MKMIKPLIIIFIAAFFRFLLEGEFERLLEG